MTAEIKAIKDGYSFVFFLGKIHNNQGGFSKSKSAIRLFIYIEFCHTSNLLELCMYTKVTTAEVALKSAQNTHKRNKISHFRSLM